MKKEMTRFTFEIPADLHQKMKVISAENKLSMRELVLYALSQYPTTKHMFDNLSKEQ